jgi:cation diffusion facilitator family transporter
VNPKNVDLDLSRAVRRRPVRAPSASGQPSHADSATDPLDALRRPHAFLGASHTGNERRTWAVIGLCGLMMLVEIVSGMLFHSMALLADGIHMATHAGAMLVSAGAYFYARRHVDDPRFSFGTGKIGDLAAFASAVVLAITSLLVLVESLGRLLHPKAIQFNEAIPVAILGLAINLASAWMLRSGHRHNGHAVALDSDLHDSHPHHHDNNLRAAYLHVMSDAAVSVLAIIGLSAGRELGWVWMDPVMGIVGACVIARWSARLLGVTGAVLLDVSPGQALTEVIRRRIETGGDRIADLHVWRVGPGHNAASLVVGGVNSLPPSAYRARLEGIPTLSHVTIEVEPISVA